jgi:hypothetical protein
MLSRMTDHTAFLEQGIRAALYALADTASRANLHLKPATITRNVRRRCVAEIRTVAILVRRLIMLMALSLKLAPLKPRAPKAPAPEIEGAEDVTASFGPQPSGFSLAPPKAGPPIRCLHGLYVVPARSVDAAPVIARLVALIKILKDPAPHARRLARTIQRWQAKGEARPHVMPMAGRNRLDPELGLVASLLPQLLNEALKGWADTS